MVIPVFAETFKINKFLPIYFLTFFGFFSKFIFLGSAGRAEPYKIRRPRLAEQGAKACRIFTRTSADSWPSDGPRPIRRPPPKLPGLSPLADPRTQKSQFSADRLPIENSSKIGLLKNPPEVAKSRSRIAKCRFRMDFESPFGIIFAPFSIILPSFFPISFWHRFWKDFWSFPGPLLTGKNNFKLILFAKSEKSQVPKSDRFCINFGIIFSSFWEPFGIIFSSFSASFLYNFLDAFLDLLFFDFEASWCQNDGFWEPLGAQLGPKCDPKSANCRQKPEKS